MASPPACHNEPWDQIRAENIASMCVVYVNMSLGAPPLSSTNPFEQLSDETRDLTCAWNVLAPTRLHGLWVLLNTPQMMCPLRF